MYKKDDLGEDDDEDDYVHYSVMKKLVKYSS